MPSHDGKERLGKDGAGSLEFCLSQFQNLHMGSKELTNLVFRETKWTRPRSLLSAEAFEKEPSVWGKTS
jgi:hypothetical protein